MKNIYEILDVKGAGHRPMNIFVEGNLTIKTFFLRMNNFDQAVSM